LLLATLTGCNVISQAGGSSLLNAIILEPTKSNAIAQSPASDLAPPDDSEMTVANSLEPRPLSAPSSLRRTTGPGESIAGELTPVEMKSESTAGRTRELFGTSTEPFEFLVESTGKETLLSEMTRGELMRHHWNDLGDDYRNFYGPQNLINLTAGFLAGGMMANTNIDSFISHKVFENVISVSNDEYTELLHLPKSLGDGRFILPLFGVTALAQPWLEQSPVWQPVGEWGNRSMRAALTGGPLVLVSQRLIGGSRPNESSSQSQWTPFQDNNGVSGHAFVGAVPFLTAAQMSDRPLIKIACYAGSVLPGISRINDERHYTSQVVLGWYIAFLATHAVNQTQTNGNGFQIFPTFDQNGIGLMFDKRF
jgi:hypothetical protein